MLMRTLQTRRYTRALLAGLGATGLLAPVLALPPVIPLPAPLYSFGADSVTVQSGLVSAAAVLALDFPLPAIAIQPAALGLQPVGDDINALSGSRPGLPPRFVFAFSVDRQTIGDVPPSMEFQQLGTPYNVADQAARGHAAGDQFVPTVLFDPNGPVSHQNRQAEDNPAIRNNYDEGGTDFSAEPPTKAHETSVLPEDNVSGTANTNTVLSVFAGATTIQDLYFSLSRESVSLTSLSDGEPSGANVFYNAGPFDKAPTTQFATYWDLGLQQGDNINAMIVIDTNILGLWDAGDVLFFSLDPNSPSLPFLGTPTPHATAGDVLIARNDGTFPVPRRSSPPPRSSASVTCATISTPWSCTRQTTW